MNCAVHQEADATGFCRNCGKAMCAVCVRPVKDVLYCEDCLASGMGFTSAPTTSPAGSPLASGTTTGTVPPPARNLQPSPGLAFFLGWVPGLGAFYNEQYGK